MASNCARGEGESSPANEYKGGGRSAGNVLAPGGVRVGESSRDEDFVESVNVGRLELNSNKQPVPKF